MKVSEFDYSLPKNLIAETPQTLRGNSRLLILNPPYSNPIDSSFSNLIDFLEPNSILVFNDTKVIRARLCGHRKTGGQVEVMLIEHMGGTAWRALLKPAKRIKEGETLNISETLLATITKKSQTDNIHLIKLIPTGDMYEEIYKAGKIPLPPYIHTQTPNKFESDYQTIFAKKEGAVAAPTAGLHFTEPLIQKLKKKGIQIETITLHVGYGTFKPVEVSNTKDHIMHTEQYEISEAVAKRLSKAKTNNRPIIAVGTTSARTLESNFRNNKFEGGRYKTNIFIKPGYQVTAISGMITNFHLPKSTLLMLISAITGRENILSAYQHAIANQYRFYSFGDAMLIKL